MCTTCGCGGDGARIEEIGHVHEDGLTHHHAHEHLHTHGKETHSHPHDHSHQHEFFGDHAHEKLHNHKDEAHEHEHPESRMISLEKDLLAKNDSYAKENRNYFEDLGVLALNLVSSPGAGKTSLLVKTIEGLKGRMPIAVIEGDQQTSFDADRIRATGAPAIQINTGKGCHLDAHLVGHAAQRLFLKEDSLLMIENVGNLVCPAAFDLGEAHKVVILSVTEGEDKPLKYPDMFAASDLMLINKVDLLPHVDFNLEQCLAYAHRANPSLKHLLVSARTGEGMEAWLAWLEEEANQIRRTKAHTIEGLKKRIAELEMQLGHPTQPYHS